MSTLAAHARRGALHGLALEACVGLVALLWAGASRIRTHNKEAT